MYKHLDALNSPFDLRKIPSELLPLLARDIRQFIIDTLSKTPGHLAASLGAVELALSVHYFFNTPEDKLVWDVGHQAYAHKIITQRKHLFNSLRQKGGISGFTSMKESVFDAFGAGHAATALSAVLGMAMGNFDKNYVAIVGDASMSSGLALEALNLLAQQKENIWLIVNDNQMSIDRNVGSIHQHLQKLADFKAKDNLFNNLGLSYTGPIDGHNISLILETLGKMTKQKGPKVLHVRTIKGKGYAPAEENPIKGHAPGVFQVKVGFMESSKRGNATSYQQIVGETLGHLMRKDPNVYVISPAMFIGSGLKELQQDFPERCIDVGIAESHAVTLAAGMAASGKKPFCVIYSTFLQRAYDQLIHDVALQELGVVFCIDRSGFVGEDGATHQGAFDMAFLNAVPNCIVSAPLDGKALNRLLYTAYLSKKRAFAIRYPKANLPLVDFPKKLPKKAYTIGYAICKKQGTRLAILSLGSIGKGVLEAIEELPDRQKEQVTWYDMCFLKPLDTIALDVILSSHKAIITLEEGVYNGGLGTSVGSYLAKKGFGGFFEALHMPDTFVDHAKVEEQQTLSGLSSRYIATKLHELFGLMDDE